MRFYPNPVAEQKPNRTEKGYLTITERSFDLVLGHAFLFAEVKEPVLSILFCQQIFVKCLAAHGPKSFKKNKSHSLFPYV